MRRSSCAGFLFAAVACDGRAPPCAVDEGVPSAGPTGNVVLVVLDDLGVDKVGAYGVHPQPAPTPRLDALAAEGVRFRSAYAQSVCWPARAALLTGRLPTVTGIGGAISRREFELPDREVLIPEALDLGSGGEWSSAAVGKWHVNGLDPADADAPLRQGFDRFDGILANPSQATVDDGLERGFFHWERSLDGVLQWSDEYLTTAQADAAIDAVRTLPEPFFVYAAFSAAHHPLHVPPAQLWTVSGETKSDAGQADAMIEALDHELGRLADALDDHTTLLVVSDNGTAGDLVRPPSDPDRSKGSFYAGGTHVPLLMVGPGVAPGVSDVLVHVTDLLPTVLDLAGITAADLGLELDGVSLLPILRGDAPARQCVIIEQFDPNGFHRERQREQRTVLDDGYALVHHDDQAEELYVRDPLAPVEGPDLLDEGDLDGDARDALHRLRRWAREQR